MSLHARAAARVECIAKEWKELSGEHGTAGEREWVGVEGGGSEWRGEVFLSRSGQGGVQRDGKRESDSRTHPKPWLD